MRKTVTSFALHEEFMRRTLGDVIVTGAMSPEFGGGSKRRNSGRELW